MENRSLSVVAGLIALLAMPLAARAADDGDAVQQAAWQERLARATALQSDSKVRQAEAGKLLEQKNAVCATKFLVNDCRNAAYQQYVRTTHEARRLENDGKALERAVKKEQAAARQQQRAAEELKREAELPGREEETAADRRIAADKLATSRADKARRAAQGERRHAADEEKYRKKRQAHEARVAEKMRQAERRAAPAGTSK